MTPGLSPEDSLTARLAAVISAYVGNHVVPMSALADLICVVDAALRDGAAAAPIATPTGHQKPAVSIRTSVQDDHLTCLECGYAFVTLKYHLSAYHQVAPKQYRAKWHLPADYPMVAPEYTRRRSKMAKEAGLGHMRDRRRLPDQSPIS